MYNRPHLFKGVIGVDISEALQEGVTVTSEDEEDKTIYHAVVNHEEQYSIWPAQKPMPVGWQKAGKTGRKAEVLNYIETAWTDMRPLSVRNQMEALKGNRNAKG